MMINIKKILREEDIEGLIQLGAPADEYDSEALEIETAMPRFGDKRSVEQVIQVLEEVWNTFFGPLSTEDIKVRRGAFERVARRIVFEPWQPDGTP